MPLTAPPPPTRVRSLNDLGGQPGANRPPLLVRARIEWATGEEWKEVHATRYDARTGAVFVQPLHDPRCQTWGAWLRREDIEV